MLPRRLLPFLLLAAAFLALVASLLPRPSFAQAGDALARVRAKREIVVGTDPTSPPFETKENGQLVGFDVDLAQALGRELGIPVRVVEMEWSGIFAALATGKIDLVMSGVTITDERKKGMAFTRPYFLSGQALARRKGDASVDGPDALIQSDKVVAVQQETTGQFSMEKRGMPGDRIHRFDTLQDGLLDVRNGRADAAVADLPTLREYIRKGYPELEVVPGGTFVTEHLGIAARPSDVDLVAVLNVALGRVMVNGAYATAYQKWTREPADAALISRLSAAENAGTPIPSGVYDRVARELSAGAAASDGAASAEAATTDGSALAIRPALLVGALPLLLRGAVLTIELTVLSLVLGTVLGLVIALMRVSGWAPAVWVAAVYVEFVRGTPLLLQIFVVYFVFPALHISLSPFVAGLAALTLNSAAYVAEIFRAGIESIDTGQREAARALGMTGAQAMRYVILPQTVRRVLPPLTNEAVALLKDSSLVSVVSLSELMRVGKEVATNAGSPTTIYLAVALLYLAMTLPLTWMSRRLEARLGVSSRRPRPAPAKLA
jgi:His/Glu/Gln/Arg/opine family amino acid ABC transporter permease subunit